MQVSKQLYVSLLFACVACSGASSLPQPSSVTPAPTPAPTAPVSAPSGAGGAGVTANATAGAAAVAPAPSLKLPPLEAGYQRLSAPAIEIPPGVTNDWMQWVGGPIDQDYDLSEMKGAQSHVGHHAILYSTTEPNPIGTTRIWTERDQLTTQTLGGVGAEGAIPIPAGVVVRVKKGSYLVFDVHYLNASEKAALGETYMDIKLAPASPNSVLASRVTNSTLNIALPPHRETVVDLRCTMNQELRLLRFTNHMHEHGVSVSTQFVDPAGTTHMIKSDPVWSHDWSLAPNYKFHPVEQPLIVPAGSVLHTRCTWKNTSAAMITFPNEMCAFSGLVLGNVDTTCLDGKSQSGPAGTAGAPAMAAGAPGMPAAGSSGVAAAAAGAGGASSAAGACAGSTDRATLASDDFNIQFKNCGASCFGLQDPCASDCLRKNTQLSPDCASCNGSKISCAMMHCVLDCSSDVASAGCKTCIETRCGAAYLQCAGS